MAKASREIIFLGCDHRGYKLKEGIKKWLIKNKRDLVDFTPDLDPLDDAVDFAKRVCTQVSKGKGRGILICGTGIGMSIAANKFKKIRAALVRDVFDAKRAKMHNDCNVLTFGAEKTDIKTAIKIISVWEKEKFLGGKYQRRNNKMNNIIK